MIFINFSSSSCKKAPLCGIQAGFGLAYLSGIYGVTGAQDIQKNLGFGWSAVSQSVIWLGLIAFLVHMSAHALVVLIYVASGGLRAVAYVDTVQCILLAVGIIVTGIIALDAAGGWTALNQGFAGLAASDVGKWGTTGGYGGGDYNAYFAFDGSFSYGNAKKPILGTSLRHRKPDWVDLTKTYE